MQPNTLSTVNNFLYFNDSTLPEIKDNAISFFSEIWEKLPDLNQQKIVEQLEFILIKPVNDSRYPNTVALTRTSPTQPTCLSWIMWYPFSSFFHKESIMFVLAHELAHVYLLHPQRGYLMNRDEEEKFKYIADEEANEQTLGKWKIKPSLEDRKSFTNINY